MRLLIVGVMMTDIDDWEAEFVVSHRDSLVRWFGSWAYRDYVERLSQ